MKKFVTDFVLSVAVVFAFYFLLGFLIVLIPEIRNFMLNPNVTAFVHVGAYEIVRRNTIKYFKGDK